MHQTRILPPHHVPTCSNLLWGRMAAVEIATSSALRGTTVPFPPLELPLEGATSLVHGGSMADFSNAGRMGFLGVLTNGFLRTFSKNIVFFKTNQAFCEKNMGAGYDGICNQHLSLIWAGCVWKQLKLRYMINPNIDVSSDKSITTPMDEERDDWSVEFGLLYV